MASRRIKSLHHNLEYQDPMEGGRNVVFHRSHRSKKGRRDIHYDLDDQYWERFDKKYEKIIEKEERRYETLA